ncbi:MAG: LamG domain-containing protein [Spirochaetes bacterium]|nr:LamG domain-containing protein [Spirochaetota bacterium]
MSAFSREADRSIDDAVGVLEEPMRRIAATAIVASVLFASCTLTTTPPVLSSAGELESFQGSYMTTFDILNGSFLPSGRALSPFGSAASPPASVSKATVPTWGSTSYALPSTVGASLTGSRANYPEPGQSTSWTVTKTAVSEVYDVRVTTTFADYDPRERQEEWYYIRNVNDAIWTNADPICTAAGVDDAKARTKNALTYRDGSVQDETIVAAFPPGSGFAAFDIAGSLEYPEAFAPVSDAAAQWSSVVAYSRVYADSPSFSFWSGNRVRAIVGVRFYTEHFINGGAQLQGSTLVFEKAATSLTSQSGDVLDPGSAFFLPDIASSPDQAYLALSVVRQKIVYDYDAATQAPAYDSATRDARTKTRVIGIANQQDKYVEIINAEAAEITNATGTIWIPIGYDPAIVNLDTAVTVDTKTTNLAVSTTDSTPVEVVTDTPINGAGTLYAAINGTPIETLVTSDITSDLLDGNGSNIVATYNGKQGTLVDSTAYAFNDKGTVQAWVYVKKTVDTPGLVHAGVLPDFSDEIWTLQFLGSNNTPVFALVAQGPSGYTYDMVKSSERLNLERWYHLAATWSRADDSMRIYVNGVLRGSRSLSNIRSSSVFAQGSKVVIGSQFYSSKTSLAGYYGFNGKINGVLIDNYAWSSADVAAFYGANKDKTASW